MLSFPYKPAKADLAELIVRPKFELLTLKIKKTTLVEFVMLMCKLLFFNTVSVKNEVTNNTFVL